MTLLRVFTLLLCLLAGTWASASPANGIVLYTASHKGTYYRFGEDIARACPKLQVSVIATDGSLDNINQLIKKPTTVGHRLAFVQNDALNTILASEPIAKQMVRPIMTMYREDIHILAFRGSNIKSLSDLNGKRVAIGTPGSGVWFTANTIRSQLGLNWVPVERSPDESILGVLIGEIDATVAVGGSPIARFNEMGKYVKDRIALVNLTEVQLNQLYTSSKLPSGTYMWQDSVVELRTTRSSLIAASDVPPSVVQSLVSCISASLPELRRWGHPKWNDVQMPPKPKK